MKRGEKIPGEEAFLRVPLSPGCVHHPLHGLEVLISHFKGCPGMLNVSS